MTANRGRVLANAHAIITRDAETASRLNAETVCGLQQALRESEANGAEAEARALHDLYESRAREVALRQAVRDLIKCMHDEESNAERDFFTEPGCVICTHGVTPDRYNTGLCAVHRAEKLLRGKS